MSDAQKLVKTVPNGKLYQVELANPVWTNASQTVDIIHMWGSSYEQGEAQGKLLGPTVVQFIDDTWEYLEDQVEGVLKAVPKWLAEKIADVGLDAALDLTEEITRLWTPTAFYDSLHGLADGSGVDYKKLMRVHMLAGLTQGKCSMVGLWGKSLDPASSTKSMQLRALDWDMDGPFRNYAAIMVFHSNGGADDGNSFITVGFPGFMGALSGINEHLVAISEIGVSYPDPSFGHESRLGVPFIFVLREILQYESTIESALTLLQDKRRTCDLILGVGDGNSNEVRGVQYSYSVCNAISDTNFIPVNASWHAPIPDAVYFGMDWICPTFNKVLGDEIRKYYGKITPLIARQQISAVEMSGDNHVVWYDLTNGMFWAAFAGPHGSGGPSQAYWRQYIQVDAATAFAEQKPTTK